MAIDASEVANRVFTDLGETNEAPPEAPAETPPAEAPPAASAPAVAPTEPTTPAEPDELEPIFADAGKRARFRERLLAEDDDTKAYVEKAKKESADALVAQMERSAASNENTQRAIHLSLREAYDPNTGLIDPDRFTQAAAVIPKLNFEAVAQEFYSNAAPWFMGQADIPSDVKAEAEKLRIAGNIPGQLDTLRGGMAKAAETAAEAKWKDWAETVEVPRLLKAELEAAGKPQPSKNGVTVPVPPRGDNGGGGGPTSWEEAQAAYSRGELSHGDYKATAARFGKKLRA